MVQDLREFIFENYYQQIGFTKEDSYHLLKKVNKKIYYCLLLTQRKKYLTLSKLKNSMNYF